MTTAGTITIGLDIDGGDVGAKLRAALQRQLAPVLAQVTRDVGGANKSLTALDGDGFRDITREAAKAATATAQSARTARTHIDAQIRDYERLGSAAERAAQRQVAAAAKAQAAGGFGGGPGGGGGGPPGGIHAGGFMRGGKGRYGFATSPVGVNLGALALGSIPAAATAVANLTGAVQQLAQAGLLIPSVFATIGTSIGTAAIGFQGMGDAIKALNEAAASGDPKDLEKAAEALKHMDVNAVNTAKAVSAFVSGPWRDLQKNTAHNMFEGIDQTINDLANKTMPTLTRGTAEVGSAWNKTFKELGRVGGLDSTQSFLDRIFGNTAEAQTRANAAINPLIHGMGTLTSEGTDFLPRLADGLTAVTTRFDNFITKAAEDGRLDKWIDQSITGIGQLGETFLNIGKIITSITQAAGGDGGLLKMLDDGSTKLANFLASAEGQEKLSAFFREGREQIALWLPVLQELWGMFVQVYNASREWTGFLLPILRDVFAAINSIPGGLEAVVTGFLAWRSITGITSLVASLSGIGGVLDALPGRANRSVGGLNSALSKFVLPAGLAALIGTQTSGMIGPNQSAGSNLGGAGLNIGGGALAGAMVGGVPGAIVGAISGLGISIYDRIKGDIDQGRAEWEAKWAADHAAGPTRPGSPEIANQITGRDRILQPSLNTPAIPREIMDQVHAAAANAAPVDAAISNLSQKAQLAKTAVEQLGSSVASLPTGELKINDPTPEIIERIEKLGFDIQELPDGTVVINADTKPAEQQLKAFIGQAIQTKINIPVNLANAPFVGPSAVPHAAGGVIPGYSPGVDNVLWPLSGGEGILIPEAVRGIGGAPAVYAINSMFRRGLSRRGYADGGVHLGTGLPPGPADDPVLALLTQIRDLLAGRGGAGSPLVDTARSTGALADATTGTGQQGQQLGPFGTPLKPRNIGYEMAAGAISALGGDPEKFLGANPVDYFAQQAGPSLPGGLPTGGARVDTSRMPLLGNNANALIAFAQQTSGGQYAAASDLANGLADCSGAVSDLVELITKGTTSPARLFTTHNAGQVLQSLGAVPGLVPGTLQVGINPEHMAATLPNGVNFESGGSGGGPRYGGSAQGANAAQFTEHWSLPVDGAANLSAMMPTAPGLPGANIATSGAPVPVWIVGGGAGMPGGLPGGFPGAPGVPGAPGAGGQGLPPGVQPIMDALTSSAGQAAAGVSGDVLSGLLSATSPTYGPNVASALRIGTPTAGSTELQQLIDERNPLFFAQAAGFNVPDYTRQGGQDDQVMANQGAKFDAIGRIYSDTAALIDRTFTSFDAAAKARHDQVMSVLTQVKDRVGEKLLKPVVQTAVTEGLDGVSDAAGKAIGGPMGSTAGPIIASAVASAIPSGGGSSGGDLVNNAFGAGFSAFQGAAGLAGGGAIYGGTPGKDSVPILAQQGEWVLNTDDVRRMGGTAGVAKFVGALRTGGIKGFATGGGVNVNDVVGAEFFGVSQIPILGLIVNILVRTLLKVIGVEIEARDTLREMSSDFRQFRGDAFKTFDASGRLLNDTAGLLDRSESSEQAVADERIRILKIVIQALVQYIIEKVIVPIAKAVANAAIQAGAGAAGGAVGSVATPAVGGIVSGVISSAGSAGVDIAAEVGTDLAVSFADVAVDAAGDGLQSAFPDIMTGIFGGGLVENLFAGPLTSILGSVLGGGLFGPLLGGEGGGILNSVTGGLFGSLFGGGGDAIAGTGGLLGGLLSGADGGFLGGLLSPLTSIFDAFTGGITGILASFLGIIPGGASLGGGFGGLGGGLFDEGGLWESGTLGANMSGATERVLNPSETRLFDSGLLGGWNLQPQQQHMAGIPGGGLLGGLSTLFGGGAGAGGGILGGFANLFRGLLGGLASLFGGGGGLLGSGGLLGGLSSLFSGLLSGGTGAGGGGLLSGLGAVRSPDTETLLVPGGRTTLVSGTLLGGALPPPPEEATATPSAGGLADVFADLLGTDPEGSGGGLLGNLHDLFSGLLGGQSGGGLLGGISNLFNGLLGGQNGLLGRLGSLFQGLFGSLLSGLSNLFTGLFSGFGGLFSGLGLGGAGGLFDDGGVAYGIGYMPKATISPERVLSPTQTDMFGRMVTALERGSTVGPARSTTIHAPITVIGGPDVAERTHDRLLSLMSH